MNIRFLSRGVLLAAVASVALAGCAPAGATTEQLAWCTLNEAQVARTALELGLMPAGAKFSDWKQSNQSDYQRACAIAAGGG